MIAAIFTRNQDRFCRLATLIFELAVIDNQGETLLNGNTYPHTSKLHLCYKEKRFGNNH